MGPERAFKWLGGVCVCGLIGFGLSMLQSRQLDRRLDRVLESYAVVERTSILPTLGEPPSSAFSKVLDEWRDLGARGRERTIAFTARELPARPLSEKTPRWLIEPLNTITGVGKRWSLVWDRRTRGLALMSIARMDPANIGRLMAAHAHNPDEEMRLNLAFGLAYWEGDEALEGLRRLAEDRSPEVQFIARLALWDRQSQPEGSSDRIEETLASISDWEFVAHYQYLGRVGPVLAHFSEPLLGLIEREPWSMKRLSMLKIYWRLTDDEDGVRDQLRTLATWARAESEADTQPARDRCGAVVNAAVFSWLSDDRFHQELEELLTIVYTATRIHRSLRLNGRGMLEGLREVYGIGGPPNLSPREMERPSRGGATEEREAPLLDSPPRVKQEGKGNIAEREALPDRPRPC